MSRVVINHAYPATPESTFIPNVSQLLVKSGFEVEVPAMPPHETEVPSRSGWGKALGLAISETASDTVLVGHSVGGINILRFLETWSGDRFAGAVLVAAPAHYLSGYPPLADFFLEAFDWEAIRKNAARFTLVTAVDDTVLTPDPVAHSTQLAKFLGAKLILLPDGGHFAPWDNCTDIPDLRSEVSSMLSKD